MEARRRAVTIVAVMARHDHRAIEDDARTGDD